MEHKTSKKVGNKDSSFQKQQTNYSRTRKIVKMKPKVKFEVASIKHIIPPINDFLNLHKRWDWSRHILDKYPVLDKKLKNVKKKSERNKITHDFFEDFILRNKDLLEKKAEGLNSCIG